MVTTAYEMCVSDIQFFCWGNLFYLLSLISLTMGYKNLSMHRFYVVVVLAYVVFSFELA